MSKQINANDLAEIVTRLLTDVNGTGELDGHETFQSFMTDIAQVVCNHCGGEIHQPADNFDDTWYVGIHGNESLPSAFGGIWREYDKEGQLFPENSPQWFEANFVNEHPVWNQKDWKLESEKFITLLSYWEWVSDKAKNAELKAVALNIK